MRRNVILFAVVALVLTSTAGLAANRGPSYLELGAAPSHPIFGSFIPTWMTSDGSIVTGNGAPFGYQPWRWSATGWASDLPLIPNIPSRDGMFLAGTDSAVNPKVAVIKEMGGTEFTTLVPDGNMACGSTLSSMYGISGDGSYVTGLTYMSGCGDFGAFLYDGTDTVNLGSVLGAGGRGDAVADDGTVVGWSYFPNSSNWRGAIYADGGWSWIDGQIDDIRSDAAAYALYKGQAFDITPDGRHVFGIHYGNDPADSSLWGSAYIWDRMDGSFTKMSDPNRDSNFVQAMGISDDGSAAIGRAGSFFSNYPVLWTAETGSIDLHWFLIGQGLDDLWFWRISGGGDVNHDGSMVAIGGYNMSTRKTEGLLVSLEKAKICHKDGTPAQRTLIVNWDSLGDHLAHGDDLATCEFLASGARSRFASEFRPATPVKGAGNEDSNGYITPNFDDAEGAGRSASSEAPVLEGKRDRRELMRTVRR